MPKRRSSGYHDSPMKRMRIHDFSIPIGILHSAMEVEGAPVKRAKMSTNNEYPVIPGVFDKPRFFGFPSTLVTRLRYHEFVTGSAALAVVSRVWNMNSIYDPYETGTGHQPMYHDIYQQIYRYYTVVGSKITCTWIPLATASVADVRPLLCGIALGDDTTFPSAVNELCEMNKSISSSVTGTTGGPALCTLAATYGAWADEGIDPYAGGDTVRTEFGSNPAERYCANTWYFNMDSSATVNCAIKVEMEFIVAFSELKDPGGS